MKQIIRWLETIFSRSEAPAVAEELSNPDVIKPDINESTIDIFLGDEVAGSMHNQESTKDVLMPDIYSDSDK